MEQPNNNEHIVEIPNNNNTNSSSTRRGECLRRWCLLSFRLWIYVEPVLTVSQIIASTVVLLVSRHEHPRAPMFTWIVGHASGCIASLPLLYWRYRVSQQGPARVSLLGVVLVAYAARNSEVEERQASPRRGQTSVPSNARLRTLVECFEHALSWFFAIWFVVVLGNVWPFGGHSSASDAPIMHGLFVVFLTLSFIGYSMFILYAIAIIFGRLVFEKT